MENIVGFCKTDESGCVMGEAIGRKSGLNKLRYYMIEMSVWTATVRAQQKNQDAIV